jgi:hypothetical protein
MHDTHPDEHTLRAYVDGELGWGRLARCAAHLRRCARCRAAVEEQRQLDRRAAGLLARLSVPADPEAGWRRVRPERRAWRPASARLVLGASALGALGIGLLVGTAVPPPFADRVSADGRTKDVCCWNLDGGPRGDDGVVTVSTAGESVACVILYDDVDGSRSFSGGDVVRFATASSLCPGPGTASATPAADATYPPSLDGLPLAAR